MGNGNDTIVAIANAYLSGNDALGAGSGTDTVSLTSDTVATNALTSAQLGALSGVEAISINNDTDTNLVNYTATLTDAIVSANVVQNGISL